MDQEQRERLASPSSVHQRPFWLAKSWGSMESLLTLGMKMRRSPTFIFVRTPLGSASWF